MTANPVLRQVAAFMGSNMAVLGAQAVSSILVARWAGPTYMGYFSSVAVVLSYAPLLLLGANNGLNRELPYLIGRGRALEVQAVADTAWSWVRTVALAAGTLLLIGSAILWGAARPLLAQACAAFALIVPLTFLSQNIEVTFRTSRDFMALSRIKFANAFLAIASAPLVWLLGWVGLLCRAVGIQAFYNILLYRNRRIRARAKFDATPFWRLIKVGLPIFSVGYLYTLYLVTDRTLILNLLTTQDMGYYTPAIQLAAAFTVIPASVNMIVYPRMCEAYGRTGSPRDLARLAYLPMVALGAGLVPVYATAWWLVDPLVHLVLPRYVDGIAAARWMVVTMYLSCLSTPQDVFTTINKLLPYALSIGAGIVVNVAVSVWLVGRGMGLTGIGVGNACGMAVLVGLSLSFSAYYVFRSGRSTRVATR